VFGIHVAFYDMLPILVTVIYVNDKQGHLALIAKKVQCAHVCHVN